MVGAVLGPFIGAAIDRFGPRRIGLAGAVAYCAAFASLALASNLIWSWWGLWLLVSISAAFVSPTVWASAVSGLFHRSRGLAIAVAMSGSGLAVVTVPAITSALLDNFGWRSTYVGIGGIWACVTIPLLWLFFQGAQDRQRLAAASTKHAAVPLPGMTAREGFCSFKYIRLAVAVCVLIFVSGGLIVNIVPILVIDGIPPTSAARIAGFAGIGVIVGRLGAGWLLDRFDANIVGGICVTLPIASSILLLGLPGVVAAAAAAAFLIGLTLGSELDAVAVIISRHFGLRSFGALFGAIVGLVNLLLGCGQLVASHIYDLTRSYDIFLWIAIPGCLLSSLLFFSVGRNPPE